MLGVCFMKVDLIQKEYVLSKDEFYILSSIVGIEKLFGICKDSIELINRERMILLLHDMQKKMMILCEHDLSIVEPYKRLFSQIRGSEFVISLETKNDELADKCFYICPDRSVVVVESFRSNNSKILMYEIRCDDIVRSLKEEGYFTHYYDTVDSEELIIYQSFCLWRINIEKQYAKDMLTLHDVEGFLKSKNKKNK